MATWNEEGYVVLSYAESYHYELLKMAWLSDSDPARKRLKKKMFKNFRLVYLAVEGLVGNA